MKLKQIVFGITALSAMALSLAACDEATMVSVDKATDQNNVIDDGNDDENENTGGNDDKNENTGNDITGGNDEIIDPSTLPATTLYCVGDSTMCNYAELDTYFYPRYGYATQLSNYFDNKVTVNNLALSGRSSYSFLKEKNYTTLKDEIKAGDYLLIGWGHNDEKAGTETFRNAKYDSIDKALEDNDSFQSCVYYNYIKLALDKGAYPILATPIVRADSNNNYDGDKGHITDYGDYRQANIDLANKYNIPVVDLTTITKNEYTKIGYSEAIKYHAIKTGTDESSGTLPKWESVDTTHINYYGANFVSYSFASALKDTKSVLKYYVKDGITKPTESILTRYSGYKWSPYSSPNLSSYSPSANLTTTTAGWYGTAFGSLGGDPTVAGNGYNAYETSSGVFVVGQGNSTGSTKYKGKIASSEEGEAFLFKQIAYNQNFTLTVDAKVLSYDGDNKQGGFGLTLKDACWLNNNDKTLLTYSVNAAVLASSASSSVINFSRDAGGLHNSSNTASVGIKKDMKASFEIKREGQNVYVTTRVYSSEAEYKEYKDTYTDFDFVSKDGNYMYVGMFGARGAIVEFTNLVYTETGTSVDA